MIETKQIWISKFDGRRWQVTSVTENGVTASLVRVDGKLDKWETAGGSTETWEQYYELEK
jgi:hypothetical protein